ncbi:Late embryogenesis abundant protein-like protein [Drosera capensis]
MAATLRDAEGNPIQLTDEHGNPVQLTDEHGNPMHLSGVAYSTAPDVPTTWPKVHGGDNEETYVGGGVGGDQYQPQRPQRPISETTAGEAYAYRAPTAVVGAGEPYQPRAKAGGRVGEIHRSSTSSSSSSEEEEEERRGVVVEGDQAVMVAAGTKKKKKKKGLKEKIMEKLTGGKQKDARQTTGTSTIGTTGTTSMIDTVTTTTKREHREDEDKGVAHATDTTVSTTAVEHRDQEKKGKLSLLGFRQPESDL